MLVSAIEGQTEVIKAGFADIAAMRKMWADNLPKLVSNFKGKGGQEEVSLTKGQVLLAYCCALHSDSQLCLRSTLGFTPAACYAQPCCFVDLYSVARTRRSARWWPKPSWSATSTRAQIR